MKMAYKLFQRTWGFNVLGSSNSRDGTQFAHIVNTPPHGWMARRVQPVDGGRSYEPVGEAVNVSHLINQHDGGEQIAKALGL